MPWEKLEKNTFIYSFSNTLPIDEQPPFIQRMLSKEDQEKLKSFQLHFIIPEEKNTIIAMVDAVVVKDGVTDDSRTIIEGALKESLYNSDSGFLCRYGTLDGSSANGKVIFADKLQVRRFKHALKLDLYELDGLEKDSIKAFADVLDTFCTSNHTQSSLRQATIGRSEPQEAQLV